MLIFDFFLLQNVKINIISLKDNVKNFNVHARNMMFSPTGECYGSLTLTFLMRSFEL